MRADLRPRKFGARIGTIPRLRELKVVRWLVRIRDYDVLITVVLPRDDFDFAVNAVGDIEWALEHLAFVLRYHAVFTLG